MLNFSRWQIRAIIGGLILIMLFAVPSFVPERVRNSWPSWVPKSSISLGLDLAGGSYLLLEADTTVGPFTSRWADRTCGNYSWPSAHSRRALLAM